MTQSVSCVSVKDPLFHIVLHEPVIPNNTGNIGRTCVATRCALHLVHPLGFDTSEKACRRAGLDYWPRLSPMEHASWAEFEAWSEAEAPSADAKVQDDPPKTWLISTTGSTPPWKVELKRGDRLVFGKETAGLPGSLLASAPEFVLTLPMAPRERSLNLATAVCAVVYEGIRQCQARGEDLDW